MFAHGAHTIKSGICVKSAFFGSHNLSTQLRWVMPLLIQQPRISSNRINTKHSEATFFFWVIKGIIKFTG